MSSQPGNVLISDTGVVKLADFGESECLQVLADGSVKGSQKVLGTPYYMSPELIRHDRAASGREADVWAVGCTALHLATGLVPWHDHGFSDPHQLLHHIAGCQTHPPIPGVLEASGVALVARCWRCVTDSPSPKPHLPPVAMRATDDIHSPDFRNFLLRCMDPDFRTRATVAELLRHPFLATPVFDSTDAFSIMTDPTESGLESCDEADDDDIVPFGSFGPGLGASRPADFAHALQREASARAAAAGVQQAIVEESKRAQLAAQSLLGRGAGGDRRHGNAAAAGVPSTVA